MALAGAQGLGFVAVLALAWGLSAPEQNLTVPSVVDPHVQVALRAEREQLLSQTAAALPPAAQGSFAAWVALQAGAHGFEVKELSWTPGPLEGSAQAVDLALTLTGDRMDLPGLLHGLFSQVRPVVLRALRVEAAPGERALSVTLDLRLYRATQPDPERVLALLQAQLPPAQAEALQESGADAAGVLLAERFVEGVPELRARSLENQKQAARQLPAWLLGLPRRGPLSARLSLITEGAAPAPVL